MFKELMSIITVDQLHEDTYNKKKNEKKSLNKKLLRCFQKKTSVIR